MQEQTELSAPYDERMPKMNTISPKTASMLFGMDLATFRYFMTKI
jgi:hypothetical protein